MNWNSVHNFLLIQIKTITTETADMDANVITVNNSFAHWIFLDNKR